MQVPAAISVTVEPNTVHTDVVVEEKVTLNPVAEVAAETGKAASPYVLSDKELNVMVWAAALMV
ncbi:MAG TPA: hypothetical protein VIG24_17455 [Acidimicrobiia bacterium]